MPLFNTAGVGEGQDLSGQLGAIRRKPPQYASGAPKANFPSAAGVDPNPWVNYITSHNDLVDKHQARMAGLDEQDRQMQQAITQQMSQYLPQEKMLDLAGKGTQNAISEESLQEMPIDEQLRVMAGVGENKMRTSATEGQDISNIGARMGIATQPQSQALKMLEILSGDPMMMNSPSGAAFREYLQNIAYPGFHPPSTPAPGTEMSGVAKPPQEAGVLRSAVHSGVPTVGGIAGWRLGAQLGSKLPGPAWVKGAGAIGGSLIGGLGGSKLMEKLDPEFGQMEPNTMGSLGGMALGALGGMKTNPKTLFKGASFRSPAAEAMPESPTRPSQPQRTQAPRQLENRIPPERQLPYNPPGSGGRQFEMPAATPPPKEGFGGVGVNMQNDPQINKALEEFKALTGEAQPTAAPYQAEQFGLPGISPEQPKGSPLTPEQLLEYLRAQHVKEIDQSPQILQWLRANQ